MIHRHLEGLRGRPIIVEPMHGVTDRQICGLWIETESSDFIFHAESASPHHRRQIVLHEYSHMIMHHSERGASDTALAALFPDLDAETVTRAFSRGSISNIMEAEAEALADMLALELRRPLFSLQERGNLGSLGL